MKKVVIKVFVVFSLVTSILVIRPFHIAYADTISQANIKGVNFECVSIQPLSQTITVSGNTLDKCIFTFHFQAILDKEYFGYITGRFTGDYIAYDSTDGHTVIAQANSYNRSFYVNGDTIDYYMQTENYQLVNQINNYTITYASQTFTYAGSNVVEVGYLTTLDNIYTTLQSIESDNQTIMSYMYDVYSGTVIENLANMVYLFREAGQYFIAMNMHLESIEEYLENMKTYNIPIESFMPILHMFDLNVPILDYLDGTYLTSYQFPLFVTDKVTTQAVYMGYNKTGYVDLVVLESYSNKQGTLKDWYLSGLSLVSYKTLSAISFGSYGYLYLRVYRFNKTTSNHAYINIYNKDYIFTPIYYGFEDTPSYSDTFAQQFGLIDVSHEEQLDDSTDDMQDSFDDMFDYEDNFNTNLNTALTNINTNFDVGNTFGSKFLASATWVRSQFDLLTSNSPFGSVLSFSLLLGLALLIIGKAVK